MATLRMQLDFPLQKGPLGPSNSTICPRTALKGPPKASEFVHIGLQQPQTKKTHDILGYVAPNAISSTPNPPATTHCWWFPPLKIALTDP